MHPFTDNLKILYIADCNEFQFTCESDQRCIPIDKKCNNEFDCADRSDESKCKYDEIVLLLFLFSNFISYTFRLISKFIP